VRFLILGDLHGRLKMINTITEKHQEIDYVLQCGDFGIWNKKDFENWGYIICNKHHYDVTDTMLPFEEIVDGNYIFNKPIIFITGNHENFDYRDSIDWDIMFKKYSIYFIKNSLNVAIPNKELSITGLNGCYSYKIYSGGYQKEKRLKCKPQTPPHIEKYLNEIMGRDSRGRFTSEDIEKLKKIKTDILLLHEYPLEVLNEGELSIKQKPGCSPVSELIEEMQPKFAFAGHMHIWSEKQFGKTKFIGLPSIERGYIILDTDNCEITKYET